MRKEKDAEYYDKHFKGDIGFQVHYKESYYFVHWTQVIVFLRKERASKILEIGCGTGQLAEYLRDEGFTGYTGFDFSGRAIEFATARVPKTFFEGNALDRSIYERYDFDTVICLEVLEHIERDLDVLKNIPENTRIIFSVPNFDAPSHVRWFTSERQVKQRYFELIDIREIVRVANIYICRGTVKSFRPTILQRFLATREEVTVFSFTKRIRHKWKNAFKIK